jgi:hypothetical protein
MDNFERLIKSQPVWTIDDIKEMSKLSKSFIRSEIKAGRLRKLTAGRRVLVLCDDLFEYFAGKLTVKPVSRGGMDVDS